jgi:hypothetical protein
MPSPITGTQGNVEFLALLRRGVPSDTSGVASYLDVLVDAALAEAEARTDGTSAAGAPQAPEPPGVAEHIDEHLHERRGASK